MLLVPNRRDHVNLPEISFNFSEVHDGEVFFDCSDELRSVLGQRNAVYLDLQTPGLLTVVRVAFPALFATRLLVGGLEIVGGFSRRKEFKHLVTHQGSSYFSIPRKVKYRYGMKLLPWMFDGWIPFEIRKKIGRDVIANYIVLNGSSGHCGVLIRIDRREKREEESMEIFAISTGNKYQFAEKWRKDSHTKLLARFVPQDLGSHIAWTPEPVLESAIL